MRTFGIYEPEVSGGKRLCAEHVDREEANAGAACTDVFVPIGCKLMKTRAWRCELANIPYFAENVVDTAKMETVRTGSLLLVGRKHRDEWQMAGGKWRGVATIVDYYTSCIL